MRIRNRVPRPRVWTTIVALLVVLTFLLPPFYGCGTKSEFLVEQLVKAAEGATISSGDKGITLEIPPDALPEDTRVTLSIVPEKEWADDIRAIEPLGSVYRLEPDGIELEKPATLTIHLDPDDLAGLNLPEGAFPACIVLTRSQDGEWDVLSNPETTVDANTGEVLVTGEATHFSESFAEDGPLAVEICPPSANHNKGDEWQATVLVYHLGEIEWATTVLTGGAFYTSGGSVKVSGPWYSERLTIAPGEDTFTIPRPKFYCKSDGKGRYGAQVCVQTPDMYSKSLAEMFFGPATEEEGKSAVRVPSHEYKWRRNVYTDLQFRIWVVGRATCVEQAATPAPVSEGVPEETEEQEEQVTCELTFDPDPCKFGEVCVGAKKLITVTVTNPCDFDVTVYDVSVGGSNTPFKVVSTMPRNLTLPKGQSYDFTIEFAPPSTEKYTDYFGIYFQYEYLGTLELKASTLAVSGTGVVCEQQAPAVSIDGSWSCDPTAAGSQLDLQQLSIKTNGQAPIEKVITIVNGVERFNSGNINATVFPPPSDRPYIFRHPMTCSGPHTATVKVFTADGETYEKTWEVYCDGEPAEQPPPPGAICPICGHPIDQCTCPK